MFAKIEKVRKSFQKNTAFFLKGLYFFRGASLNPEFHPTRALLIHIDF